MELENTLEQEQEALVNKLWKRMDKLEAEKRMLQIKLDQPVSDPASPREISNGDTATNLSAHIQTLRSEVARLRQTLAISQQEHTQKMQRYAQEERNIKEENLRLQRKLQLEVERREALCRHLSESESSLEMEEERHYNEQVLGIRQHTVSPVPYNPSPNQSRPLSPGKKSEIGTKMVDYLIFGWHFCVGLSSIQALSPRDSLIVGPPRCHSCGQLVNPACVSVALHTIGSSSPPAPPHRRTSDRFIKPAIPAPQPASPMDTSVNKE